jgi:predicted acylesterase/phospholipase RssA
LLFLDVPRLVLPAWVLDTHRGDYFEDFVARRWLALTKSDYFYRPLTRAAGDGQHRTAVYLNATDALSGQYIALTARQTDSANATDQLRLSALNMAILDRLPDIRIAQAVHMSARFPYLSPNPDLRIPSTEASLVLFGQTASTLRATGMASLASLVDGGYFDNSGLWPALRMLERDGDRDSRSERSFIHIVNDQTRGCKETPSNTGCIRAQSKLIEERRSSHGGWLSRPLQAIEAVRSEHSLESLTALELAQFQLKAEPPLVWKVPMPELQVVPGFIDWLLNVVQWLPIHGRDLRYGGVALAWTLAPQEREFICVQAAAIRTTGTPGIRSSESVDRSKECASPPN